MGYTIFSVGDEVRVSGGAFVGVEGVVVAPTASIQTGGTVVLKSGSMLLPVTVSTIMDGHVVALRVPPELLERIPESSG